MSFQMQNGSLEWHKKRQAAKTTSHFLRNQIEDYKSSQKWNKSTRLDNSPVFFFSFYRLLWGFLSLYCAVLLHNKGANSSVQPASVCRVWRSPGLRLHRGWLIPTSAAFQHVRLPLNAKLPSWIGRLARCGTVVLGLRGTDDTGRTDGAALV